MKNYLTPKYNVEKLNRAGFTIIELMIATAVFSVLLLLCATAIVQVGKMYYKSTILVRTMDTTRAVSDDVSQAIQFGNNSIAFFVSTGPITVGTPSVTVRAYCLGSIRYTYASPNYSLGTGSGQVKHILWKDKGADGAANCSPVDLTIDDPTPHGQELLGKDMRLPAFNIVNNAGIWSISTTIAYGSTDDLFSTGSDYKTCVGSVVGGQFCAVSSINTNAIKRL